MDWICVLRERGARRWLWECDLSTWKADVLTHKCEMSPGGVGLVWGEDNSSVWTYSVWTISMSKQRFQ